MALEFEDLFVVLGLAAAMNVVGRFFGGGTSAILQYGVPLAVVPLLMIFKYGKPRGYLRDLVEWHAKPRAYCALADDKRLRAAYVKRGGVANAIDARAI
jgi:hypothetical protein